MSSVFILFIYVLIFTLLASFVVGAVMFCVDIWKWSTRPEIFTSAEDDLKKNVKKGDVK